tara:strand:- start:954 stop:1937 length:984 start_codon:yes stop_codon:yes gene_type:complete
LQFGAGKELTMKLVNLIVFISLFSFLSACSSTSVVEPHLEKPKEYWYEDTELNAIDISYAKASWVYSIVADRTYLEKITLCLPFSDTWQEVMIDRNEYSKMQKNGFDAQAWLRTRADNNKKELIIAFRGTDSFLSDFLYANLVFWEPIIGESQFVTAVKFRDAVLRKIEAAPDLEYDDLIFVGHSLGGGLAQYLQDYSVNSQAYVFNASPNRGRLYKKFGKPDAEKYVTRMYEKGEVLQYLRLFSDTDRYDNDNPGGKGMNTRWINFYSWNLIANHSMKDFSTALIRLAVIGGDKEAEKVMAHMIKRSETGVNAHKHHCTIANTHKV